FGLTSTAITAALGTISRRISTRFTPSTPPMRLMPVMLPPGRARLATSPACMSKTRALPTDGCDRKGLSCCARSATVRSMCRGLPEKIGVHNPPLLSLGFSSDPLNIVHEPFQIARHENLIFGSDVGTPVDVDLRVADVLERTFCVEHHNDIIDII